MKRPGNTTLVIVVAVCVTAVLCCLIVVGGLVYLSGKPGGGSDGEKKPPARIAELVPDADARARLDGFYGDWSDTLLQDDKPCRTTDQFREAYRRSVVTAQAKNWIPSVKAIDEPISERIKNAIGVADTNLDGEPPLRTNLARVLAEVSDDFGGR